MDEPPLKAGGIRLLEAFGRALKCRGIDSLTALLEDIARHHAERPLEKTPATATRVVELYCTTDLTVRAIASLCGVHEHTVSKMVRRAGKPLRAELARHAPMAGDPRKPEVRQRVFRMIASGAGTKAITEATNLEPYQVEELAKEFRAEQARYQAERAAERLAAQEIAGRLGSRKPAPNGSGGKQHG